MKGAEDPARQAARAWLAEPAVEEKIKAAIQARFNARIAPLAYEQDAGLRDFLADLEEEHCLALMKQTMKILAAEHLQSGREEAERTLAFLLPLIRQWEIPECAS